MATATLGCSPHMCTHAVIQDTNSPVNRAALSTQEETKAPLCPQRHPTLSAALTLDSALIGTEASTWPLTHEGPKAARVRRSPGILTPHPEQAPNVGQVHIPRTPLYPSLTLQTSLSMVLHLQIQSTAGHVLLYLLLRKIQVQVYPQSSNLCCSRVKCNLIQTEYG